MAGPPRLLVIAPAWVGDMVMAQSLFKLLREREGADIDVVGPPWSVPLAGRMPEVGEVIPLEVRHGEAGILPRWHLGRVLRARAYDRAIVLPRSFKSALVPWFARVPVRTGFAAELRRPLLTDPRVLDRRRLDQTVKRFVALGLRKDEPLPEALPSPALRADPMRQAELRAMHGLDERSAVAMMPGAAYGPAKQWPVEHFGALASMLVQRGAQVWVMGSAGERALGEAIRTAAGAGVRNLCGITSLADAVDLLALCRAAVSNDSGLMHVAAASGTHVVAIYGSSTPVFTPPLTSRRTVLYQGLDCSPCFERRCPLKHLACLRGIAPEAVLDGLPEDAGGRASTPIG